MVRKGKQYFCFRSKYFFFFCFVRFWDNDKQLALGQVKVLLFTWYLKKVIRIVCLAGSKHFSIVFGGVFRVKGLGVRGETKGWKGPIQLLVEVGLVNSTS